MSENSETWKTIIDFPMYSVSNLGRVRRDIRVKFHGIGGVLRPGISNGYPHVMLVRNGAKFGCSVHRLVTEMFLGPAKQGYVVNHKDGDKKNNVATNLEYVTPSENNLHASAIGLLPKGEKHGMAKLTGDIVLKMRNLHKCGWKFVEIGRRFNVSYVCAREAIKGRTWAHVK